MFKKYIVTGLALLSCGVANADTWHTSTISKVYPQANGSFILIFSEDAALCTNAPSGKYHYVEAGSFGVNADGVRTLLATSLTAFAMGKTVTILFNEAHSYCYINRMFMSS